MIVVTGAIGQLGEAVVEALLRRVPAKRLIASARHPGKAAALAARGVDVRRSDFDDPHGLETAFAGAEQALIVSADKLGDEALRLHRTPSRLRAGPVPAASSTPATWELA